MLAGALLPVEEQEQLQLSPAGRLTPAIRIKDGRLPSQGVHNYRSDKGQGENLGAGFSAWARALLDIAGLGEFLSGF